MRTEGGHRPEVSRDHRTLGLPHRGRGRTGSTKGRGASSRHLHQRRVIRRNIRKVLFLLLLVGTSMGMGYMVSRYQPSTEQPE